MSKNTISLSTINSIVAGKPTPRPSRNRISFSEIDKLIKPQQPEDIDGDISKAFGQSNSIDLDDQISSAFGQSNDITSTPPAQQQPEGFELDTASIGKIDAEQVPDTKFQKAKKLFSGEEKATLLSQQAPELVTAKSEDLTSDPLVLDRFRDLQLSGATIDEMENAALQIDGVSSFQDSRGNKFLKFPTGRVFIINRPGASRADFISLAGEIGSQLLGAKGAGLLKGPGKALLGKIRNISASATGAATVEGLKGAERVALGSGESATEVLGEAATAAALDTGGEVAGGLLKGLGTAVGKGLTKTGLLSDAGTRLNKLTGFNKKSVKEESIKIAKDVFEGKQFSLAKEGKKIQKLTESLVEGRRNLRETTASPIFKKAFKETEKKKVKVKVGDILDSLKKSRTALGEARDLKQASPTTNILAKAETILEAASKKLNNGSNVQSLHLAKRELFELAEKVKKEGGLSAGAKNIINQTRKALRKRLGAVSSDYNKANIEFARISGKVSNIEDLFDSITSIKPKKRAQVAKQIFDSKASTKDIRNMKRMIDTVDRNAWNRLQRAYLQDKLSDVSVKSSEDFIPEAINKLFSGSQVKNTRLFLSTGSVEGRKAAKNIQTLLNRLPGEKAGFLKTVDRRVAAAAKQLVDFDTTREKTNAALMQVLLTDVGISKSFDNLAKASNLTNDLVQKRMKNIFSVAIDRTIDAMKGSKAIQTTDELFEDLDKAGVLEDE